MEFDYNNAQELFVLADHNIKLAEEYALARKLYAEAKYNMDIIISSALPEIRKQRPNCGYDMALMMIIENTSHSDELKGYYEESVKQENRFRGLEKLIEAHLTKITLTQSILKYTQKQTG